MKHVKEVSVKRAALVEEIDGWVMAAIDAALIGLVVWVNDQMKYLLCKEPMN